MTVTVKNDIVEETRQFLIDADIFQADNNNPVGEANPLSYAKSREVPSPPGPSDEPVFPAKVWIAEGQGYAVPDLEEFRIQPTIYFHIRANREKHAKSIGIEIRRLLNGKMNLNIGNIRVSAIRNTSPLAPVGIPENEAIGFIYVIGFTYYMRENQL